MPSLASRRQHHSDAAECVYVADNPTKDFAAPRALGWHTVRIRRPGGLHAGLAHSPHEVDHEITSLTELRHLPGWPSSQRW